MAVHTPDLAVDLENMCGSVVGSDDDATGWIIIYRSNGRASWKLWIFMVHNTYKSLDIRRGEKANYDKEQSWKL